MNKTNSLKPEDKDLTSVFFACDKGEVQVEGVLESVPVVC